MKSTRIDLVENEDFLLQAEYNEQYFVLHLPRLKPSKGAIEHLKVKVEELDEMTQAGGWDGVWAGIFPDDNKTKKLLGMLHFTFVGHAQGIDAYKYVGEN